MSLFIVGSLSKITNNIIVEIARKNVYKSIVVSDLLPHYTSFNRYYALRQKLSTLQTNTNVSLAKLIENNDINTGVHKADDVLFVTHDYYLNVTSKLKLMELTAKAANNKKNVTFITPLEHDHLVYSNPHQKYLQTEEKVRNICPNATILRTNIVQNSQFYSYLSAKKKNQASFLVKLVTQQLLANAVNKVLFQRQPGKKFILNGSEQVSPLTFVANEAYQFDQINREEHFNSLVKKYPELLSSQSAQALSVSV